MLKDASPPTGIPRCPPSAVRFEKRAKWYQQFTGRSIADVSLQEQNDLCDKYAHHFRDYSDGRETANAAQKQRTDPDLLSMPQLTNLCMSCSKAAPGRAWLIACRVQVGWRDLSHIRQRLPPLYDRW